VIKGDSLSYHLGMRFTTKDKDNDMYDFGWYNCARKEHGAWWYKTCGRSNLNGRYIRGGHTEDEGGIFWETARGMYYSMKSVVMKIKPYPW